VPEVAVLRDQVVITGLPERPDFLIQGSYTLKATLTKADGSPPVDCNKTAVWTSDNSNVARMITPETDYYPQTEFGNVLVVGDEGEANITATCSGVSGQRRVRVSHFDFRGTVRGADGQPLSGVLVRARRVFPDASTSVATTGADGTYSVPVRLSNGFIEFSRQGFGLSSTAFNWNLETVMTANGSLEPTSATIASGSGRLCNVLSTQPGSSECESAGVHRRDAAIDFVSPRNTPIFVRVQWPGGAGVTGEFTASLQCDNRTVFSYHELDGAGVGYSYDANTSCRYRLVLANTTSVRIVPYSYTIEIR
jgi:hypothetical protein